MSGNTGTIKLTLQMDGKGTIRVLKTVGSESDKTGKKGKASFDKMDKSARSFSKSARAGARSIISMKTAVVGLIAVGGVFYLKSMAASFTSAASQAKNLEIALDTITKGKGVETFEALNSWAMKMPINTMEAMKVYQQLKAYGLDPITKDMTTLVDASSSLGGGSGTMAGISRALGQMYTNQKILREEINQLTERGIPALDILQEELGLTADQMRDIGNAGIDVNEALGALMTGMEKRYGGASAKMMKEWSGMIESSKSMWFEFRRVVMESGPFDAMKEELGEFLDYLSTNEGQMNMAAWAQHTAVGTMQAFKLMTQSAHVFYTVLQDTKILFTGVMQGVQGLRLQGMESGINDIKKAQTGWASNFFSNERKLQNAEVLFALEKQRDALKNNIQYWKETRVSARDALKTAEKGFDLIEKKFDQWAGKTKDIKFFGGAKDLDGVGIGNQKKAGKSEQDTKEYKKFLSDKAAAISKFTLDYKRITLSSFNFERNQLKTQYNEYNKYITDKIALNQWYELEMKRIAQEETEAAQDAAEKLKNPIQQYADSFEDMTTSIQKGIVGTFQTMEDSLVDFVMTGKLEYKSLARSIIADMIRIMIQQTIMKGATSFIGGLFSAQGNAFNSSGVMAYAHGGTFTNKIVDQPTLFAHGGGLGVMGELGRNHPEGIFPLARTSSGDLGVQAVGGGEQAINIKINIDDKTDSKTEVTAQQPLFDGEGWVIGIVLDAMQRNRGGFANNMKAMVRA